MVIGGSGLVCLAAVLAGPAEAQRGRDYYGDDGRYRRGCLSSNEISAHQQRYTSVTQVVAARQVTRPDGTFTR